MDWKVGGLIALLLCGTAYAEGEPAGFTAGKFNEWAEQDDGFTLAYVMGVADTWRSATLTEEAKGIAGIVRICFPEGNTYGQMHAIAVKYVKDHPESWHMPANTQVLTSLFEAFPCPAE